MPMFFPSTYPSSRKPSRNASMRAESEEAEPATRTPMRGTFFGCSAHAEKQNAKSTAETSIADLQFRIANFKSVPERCPIRIRPVLILFVLKFEICDSKCSPDQLVRARQHIRRDRQA